MRAGGNSRNEATRRDTNTGSDVRDTDIITTTSTETGSGNEVTGAYNWHTVDTRTSSLTQTATLGVGAAARTRISKNHQVTIPLSQFEAAELQAGDRFRVMATGPGRIELTRVDELAGQLALDSSGR